MGIKLTNNIEIYFEIKEDYIDVLQQHMSMSYPKNKHYTYMLTRYASGHSTWHKNVVNDWENYITIHESEVPESIKARLLLMDLSQE